MKIQTMLSLLILGNLSTLSAMEQKKNSVHPYDTPVGKVLYQLSANEQLSMDEIKQMAPLLKNVRHSNDATNLAFSYMGFSFGICQRSAHIVLQELTQ